MLWRVQVYKQELVVLMRLCSSVLPAGSEEVWAVSAIALLQVVFEGGCRLWRILGSVALQEGLRRTFINSLVIHM